MPDDPGEAYDWCCSVGQPVTKESVDVRPWLAMRVEQWKRVAPMASLGIQGVTLAGVVYGLVAYRGVHPAFMGLLFLAVVAVLGGGVLLWRLGDAASGAGGPLQDGSPGPGYAVAQGGAIVGACREGHAAGS